MDTKVITPEEAAFLDMAAVAFAKEGLRGIGFAAKDCFDNAERLLEYRKQRYTVATIQEQTQHYIDNLKPSDFANPKQEVPTFLEALDERASFNDRIVTDRDIMDLAIEYSLTPDDIDWQLSHGAQKEGYEIVGGREKGFLIRKLK